MFTLSTLSAFLPAEALAILIMVGGIAFMLGARRLAVTLIGLAIAGAVLPPLLEPLLEEAPEWLLVLLVLLISIAPLRAVLSVFLGGRATDHAIGHFVGSLLVGLFLLPFFVLRGSYAALTSLIRRIL